MWGFGLEIVMLLSDKDRKALPVEIILSDGRRLNVVVRERLPICNECRIRGAHTLLYFIDILS